MNTLLLIIASVLGSTATYLVSCKLNKSPVLSSALLSLIFALVIPFLFEATLAVQLNLAFFGGSFVGMSNIKIIKNWKEVAFAGFIFGLLYLVTTNVFKGYGGGLGFKATISVLATIGLLFLKVPFVTFVKKLKVLS